MRRDHTPTRTPSRRRPVRRERSALRRAGTIVALLVAGAFLFLTWPQSLGGRVAYIMVSGHSMEPTMHIGDLAVIRAEPDYHVGDIIAYRVPDGQVGAGVPVIHRIVGGDARTGFITRGDHNPYNDPWRPHPSQIIGARWALLPRVATVFSHMRGPLPLAAFAALLTMIAATGLLKHHDDPPDDPSEPEPEPEHVTAPVSLGTDEDARVPIAAASH